MPFWSGETLTSRLAEIIPGGDPGQIDCNAYTLCIGSEYYVSPSDDALDAKTRSVRPLAAGEAFTVPPGQFAYLISQESIKIPSSAMAFISIRAKVKWKGLINVSGFHVDPGYAGKLVFAVYNAGPTVIHLRQGDPIFLIWFADLDRDTAMGKPPPSALHLAANERIDASALTHVGGELHSLGGLAKKLHQVDKDLAQRITRIEVSNSIVVVAAGIVVSAAIFLGGQWVVRQIYPPPPVPAAASPTVNQRGRPAAGTPAPPPSLPPAPATDGEAAPASATPPT